MGPGSVSQYYVHKGLNEAFSHISHVPSIGHVLTLVKLSSLLFDDNKIKMARKPGKKQKQKGAPGKVKDEKKI